MTVRACGDGLAVVPGQAHDLEAVADRRQRVAKLVAEQRKELVLAAVFLFARGDVTRDLGRPTIFPSASLTGEIVSETSTRLPSLRTRSVSKCSMHSPRRMRSMISGSSSGWSAGTRARQRLPHDFVGRVTVQPLGPTVPTDDGAVEGLADDGVFRRLHDGRQVHAVCHGAASFSHVAEHQHRPADRSVLAFDGRGRVFDGHFAAVLGDERRCGWPGRRFASRGRRCSTGFSAGQPRLFVDDAKDPLQRLPAASWGVQPVSSAATGLTNVDGAAAVGDDHRIADAGERDVQLLALAVLFLALLRLAGAGFGRLAGRFFRLQPAGAAPPPRGVRSGRG